MPTVAQTVESVLSAGSWEERVARIRLVPQNHGTGEHQAIYAEIARSGYVQHLAPDFAYIHEADFYELPAFRAAYDTASLRTNGFTNVSAAVLAETFQLNPETLLVFRTMLGLTGQEFAHASGLVAEPLGVRPLSQAKVNSMERDASRTTEEQALLAAETIVRVMAGELFGEPPGDLKSKQDKPDTIDGWESVRRYADGGVPYEVFLHQRHYGGAFRQVLDATSTLRGNLIEDAVEALFRHSRVPYLRTGSHNQAEIESRFGVRVTPAPDFVVFDGHDTLRAMLECKGANDGGTARDKALRFATLRREAVRLGGVPLLAVLSGMGWARVNDTLGPVVRDTDGRVFTLANLDEMLSVAPFPELVGTAPELPQS